MVANFTLLTLLTYKVVNIQDTFSLIILLSSSTSETLSSNYVGLHVQKKQKKKRKVHTHMKEYVLKTNTCKKKKINKK